MINRINRFEKDTRSVVVDVTKGGEPFPLTGATIEFVMRRGRDGVTVSLPITVTDAPGGIFEAAILPDAMTAGAWTYQARVTKDGITDTVAHGQITVDESI